MGSKKISASHGLFFSSLLGVFQEYLVLVESVSRISLFLAKR